MVCCLFLTPLISEVAACWQHSEFLYITGGYCEGQHLPISDLFRVSLETFRWECIQDAASPEPRHSSCVVVYKDKIIMIGGIGQNSTYFTRMMEYDLKTYQWNEVKEGELEVATPGVVPVRPVARWGASCVVYKDSIYLFGGFGTIGVLSDFWEFNLATLKWSRVSFVGAKPGPRHYHTAVNYEDKMYIFCGYDGRVNLSELVVFEYATGQMSITNQDMPALRGHSSILYKNSVYLWGGILAGASFQDRLWKYNMRKNTYRLVETNQAPTPRHYHNAIFYNNRMYIFGGVGSQNYNNFFQFTFDYVEDPPTIASDFGSLLNSKEFSDITFSVGDTNFFAHKCVLATRSDYFRGMLGGSMRESNKKIIKLEELDPDIFARVLAFIYTGKSDLRPDTVVEVLEASSRFLLEGLSRECQQILAKTITTDNVTELITVGSDYNGLLLLEKSFQFVERHKIDISHMDPPIQSMYKKYLSREPVTGPVISIKPGYTRIPKQPRVPRQQAPVVDPEYDQQHLLLAAGVGLVGGIVLQFVLNRQFSGVLPW